MPQWDINVALEAIPKYHVSNLMLIPSVVHQLVHHPGVEKVDFSSVLGVNSGAAYLPPELADKMQSLIPAQALFGEGKHFDLPFQPRKHILTFIFILIGYGMSEAVCIIAGPSPRLVIDVNFCRPLRLLLNLWMAFLESLSVYKAARAYCSQEWKPCFSTTLQKPHQRAPTLDPMAPRSMSPANYGFAHTTSLLVIGTTPKPTRRPSSMGG